MASWTPGAALRAEMQPGEFLRVEVQPLGAGLARSTWGTVPLGLAMIALALFLLDWKRGWGINGSTLFTVAMGGCGLLFMLQMPLAWWRASRMAYGVTNQRVLILDHFFGRRRVTSVPPIRITHLERRDDTLILARESETDSEGRRTLVTALHGLPDSRATEAAVLRLLGR